MQQTIRFEEAAREPAPGAHAKRLDFDEKHAKEVIARYEGVICGVARRLRPMASLSQAMDIEDLFAEGRVAVLEAVATYQSYGISEQTWVRTRVRQRMIDAIRKLDLRSRDEMSLAVRHASGETEGSPEHERGRLIAARRLVSIDAGTPEAPPLTERLTAEHLSMADELTHERRELERLREAIGLLPDRQRLAMEMGLFEGLSLRQIGEVMGISESRVCQLQKRAIQHLRRQLAPRDEAALRAA